MGQELTERLSVQAFRLRAPGRWRRVTGECLPPSKPPQMFGYAGAVLSRHLLVFGNRVVQRPIRSDEVVPIVGAGIVLPAADLRSPITGFTGSSVIIADLRLPIENVELFNTFPSVPTFRHTFCGCYGLEFGSQQKGEGWEAWYQRFRQLPQEIRDEFDEAQIVVGLRRQINGLLAEIGRDEIPDGNALGKPGELVDPFIERYRAAHAAAREQWEQECLQTPVDDAAWEEELRRRREYEREREDIAAHPERYIHYI
jgi:hypothetical protein